VRFVAPACGGKALDREFFGRAGDAQRSGSDLL